MKKAFYGTMCITALLATPAFADDPQAVVRDSAGNVIMNSFGNCVRTQWLEGSDACAHETAAAGPMKTNQLNMEQLTVHFAFDSAVIAPDQQSKLQNLAEVLKADSDVKNVTIVGYADRIGTTEHNEKLSQQRAQNVEHYLQQHEYLNTSVAQVRGAGSTDPTTHCGDKLGKKDLINCLQPDRRVEVEVHYYTVSDDDGK